ncbi:MAG: hypothetical protein ACOCQD_05360 [archaeon]
MKDFKKYIEIAILAHSENYVKNIKDAYRFGNKNTPYSIHPIWCASTLLTEHLLTNEIKTLGYKSLLLHDVIEDTNYKLDNEIEDDVISLVKEMTFSSFKDETKKLEKMSDLCKLFKLYDKVSNLLDCSWMNSEQKKKYLKHTKYLIDFVEKKYGQLNIIIIGKNICISIEKQLPPTFKYRFWR